MKGADTMMDWNGNGRKDSGDKIIGYEIYKDISRSKHSGKPKIKADITKPVKPWKVLMQVIFLFAGLAMLYPIVKIESDGERIILMIVQILLFLVSLEFGKDKD